MARQPGIDIDDWIPQMHKLVLTGISQREAAALVVRRHGRLIPGKNNVARAERLRAAYRDHRRCMAAMEHIAAATAPRGKNPAEHGRKYVEEYEATFARFAESRIRLKNKLPRRTK